MSDLDKPRYDDLPAFEKTGARHAWGVFGQDDEVGSLNWITPEAVRAAAAEVRTGEVIGLDLPLTLPSPPMVGSRQPLAHHVTRTRTGRDDHLDSFYLQGSTQWDGLAHVRYREFGYWGGRQEDDLDAGRLGIDRMARRGVVGRGVLVDVAAHKEHLGHPVDPTARESITPAMLDAALDWQGVALRPGDIVLLRTGWMGWYLGLGQADRDRLAARLTSEVDRLDTPGLDAHPASAAWIWNHRVAAMAADNPALEVLRVDPEVGFLHRLLIPLLGLNIGELFDLDELSRACRREGRYSFLLTSSPLRLPSGVGSPAGAYAIL